MTMTDKSRMIDGVELTPKTVASIGRPTYATLEEERQARKIGLAAALRVFGRLGFGEGVAGHITARDPEDRKSTRLNSSHEWISRMPSSA